MTDTNENWDDLDALLEELLNSDSDSETVEETEPEDPETALLFLVTTLVEKHNCSAETALEWVLQSGETLGQQTERKRQDAEELLALCDGPFQVLRDNTFPDPEKLLVFDRQVKPVVQALTFEEAVERYQCGGKESLWSRGDLEELKVEKRKCLGETLESYAEVEKGSPDDNLFCSTPVLQVSNNPLVAHRWCVVKARPLQTTH